MKDEASALEAKLDILIKLTAISVTSGVESLKDKAILLNKAGLTPKEIAALFDSTPNAVSVALSNAKKASK